MFWSQNPFRNCGRHPSPRAFAFLSMFTMLEIKTEKFSNTRPANTHSSSHQSGDTILGHIENSFERSWWNKNRGGKKTISLSLVRWFWRCGSLIVSGIPTGFQPKNRCPHRPSDSLQDASPALLGFSLCLYLCNSAVCFSPPPFHFEYVLCFLPECWLITDQGVTGNLPWK